MQPSEDERRDKCSLSVGKKPTDNCTVETVTVGAMLESSTQLDWLIEQQMERWLRG